jgi:hypothetical protein
VLQQLGFTNVKVYDSSWLGYGNKRLAESAIEQRIAGTDTRLLRYGVAGRQAARAIGSK